MTESVISSDSRLAYPTRPAFAHSAVWYFCFVGALKATNIHGFNATRDGPSRVENEKEPCARSQPDLSTVSFLEATLQMGEHPIYDDEDLEALRAVYGAGATSGQV